MEGSSSNLRAAIAACALFLCAAVTPADADDHIVLLNWSEYFDQALIEEFTAETGIGVEEIYYSSDTDRDAILARAEPGEFDVVIVSGNRLELLSAAGWLAPIGEQQVPNAAYIDEEWRTLFPSARQYALPMASGTVGVAYRRDLLSRPITRWSDVFEPDEELCGRLWMFGDTRENVELALLALGHYGLTPTATHLAEARQLLLDQRDCVAEYDYIDINERSQLIVGDAAATVTYSGEAIYLSSIDARIEYALPDDRTIIWFDHYTIPSSSARKEQAYRFLDFMNRPANAARLAETLSIISPNQAARDLLPEELKHHPALTPPQGTLTLVEQPRDARTVRLINALSSELIIDAGATP